MNNVSRSCMKRLCNAEDTIRKKNFFWVNPCVWHNSNMLDYGYPDRPFRNFRASLSGDWPILCSSRTSCNGLLFSKVVKGLVGMLTVNHASCLYELWVCVYSLKTDFSQGVFWHPAISNESASVLFVS